MAFFYTGAPYKSRGSIPPVYIVFRAACFSPQFSFVVYVLPKCKFIVKYYAQVFQTVHLK